MTNSRVSILMPVYNAAPYIHQAVNSILNQTYKNFELLIVNDGSTDNSYQLLQEYEDPRIKLYNNKENLGVLKSSNFLFGEVKGNFIAFQDADDWSHPEKIKKQVDYLMTNSDVSACLTDSYYVDAKGNKVGRSYYPEETKVLTERISEDTIFVVVGTIMITKSMFDNVLGYRDYFDRLGSEHEDWLYRIIEHSSVGAICSPLYSYRRHSVSMSNNILDQSFSKLNSHKIARHLYQQRKMTETDDLFSERFDELENYHEKLNQELAANKHYLYLNRMNLALMNNEKKALFSVMKQYFYEHSISPKTYFYITITLLKLIIGKRFFYKIRGFRGYRYITNFLERV